MIDDDLRAVIDRNLDAVEAKDADAVLAGFADDGVLIDPHYPDPRMQGKASIEDGLRFGFGGMRTFRFDERTYYSGADGSSAVVRCMSRHVLQNGRPLTFPQVFVVETRGGLITRWQAFEPYGPNGVVGVFLGIAKSVHRVRRRRRR